MRRLAPLALVVALALPAGATAQSAGDEQYADPFAPSEQPQQPAPPPSAPAPAPSGEVDDQVDVEPAAPAAGVAQTDPSGTLPRTGFPAALALAAGWWMLLGGLALRRVL
ncbi:MAG: hypothetical protein ACRDLD_15115 [Thermoleophilaceae bacterium]